MNGNQVTPKSIIDLLMQFTSREQALNYMESGGFSNSFLKEIGKEGFICFYGSANKKKMIESIVEATTGSKLKYDALLSCNLH